MPQTAAADVATARPKLSVRTGSSRKLLERKARETAGEMPTHGGVEDSFPPSSNAGDGDACVSAAATLEPTVAPLAVPIEDAAATPYGPPAPPPANAARAAAAWSSEDESLFRTLFERRKAAGYQRRGRDVSEQTITLGGIAPNPGTVVAVIVAIVADRGGSVGRAGLVAAMATADYPTAKARPDDKGWCQGYVAGAVRNGFLALADAASVATAA